MKASLLKSAVLFAALMTGSTACQKRLDLSPYNTITGAEVYTTPEGTKEALAKVYGSFATTGNSGPAGSGDIQGIDEGTSDFVRLLWCAQELSTDEAVTAWSNDVGLFDFHDMNWSSGNPFLLGLYQRSIYQISLVNEFLRNTTDGAVAGRGFSESDKTEIKYYRQESRFLRALQYWVLVDHFGNPPFITENSVVGPSFPPRGTRTQVFSYIESELKDIESKLKAPRTNEYGRADQAAAWALLARLYLNAEVYTGTARYADAATYAKKVIDAGYSLAPNYQTLGLADNNLLTSEFIFTVNYDGVKTKNYGGTTFLTHCPVPAGSAIIRPDSIGIEGGWTGMRTTKAWILKFGGDTLPQNIADKRAQFVQRGQRLDIGYPGIQFSKRYTTFADGYVVLKYRNRSSTGGYGSDPARAFSDVDFPLFRLGEMYLIYAEAAARGAADRGLAVQYLNTLRGRANASLIGDADLTPDFILDERARELYWECHRRTDLVRFNRFTTNAYVWPWKGGTFEGKAVEDFRNLYPIPSSDLTANPNLKQNDGY